MLALLSPISQGAPAVILLLFLLLVSTVEQEAIYPTSVLASIVRWQIFATAVGYFVVVKRHLLACTSAACDPVFYSYCMLCNYISD